MKKKGFSIIELMVVVAVLAILAGIAIPYFAGAKRRAFLVACKENLRNISRSLDMYRLDYHLNDLNNYILSSSNNFLIETGFISKPFQCPVSKSYYILNYSSNNDSYTIFCPFPTEHYKFPIKQCTQVEYSSSNGFIIK